MLSTCVILLVVFGALGAFVGYAIFANSEPRWAKELKVRMLQACIAQMKKDFLSDE